METLILIFSIVNLVVLILVLILLFIIKFKKNNNATSDLKIDLQNSLSNLKMEVDNKLSNVEKNLNNTVNQYLDNFKNSTSDKLDMLTSTLKENVNNINNSVKENTSKIEEYLNSIRSTLSTSIKELQEDNNKKIDEMRKTVDEKLDSTLNKRLNESFQMVQENLLKVESGLGEMKSLAGEVGSLQKTLNNVKTRGTWGEVQLSQILSDILTVEQYESQIIVKPHSKDPVDFAVKLPGDGNNIIYLPIDSKFPLDAYNNLIDAYDNSKEDYLKAADDLKKRVKLFAKSISEKYIAPPQTTDFGIMFLPIEGLYAEVAKSGLIEELQNTYRIIIAGPTTMAALLNSLQVGFKTLAIQKRSSEVWNLLAAVKGEFSTFEEVLTKAQTKIKEAGDNIEKLVGTRTRKIQSKLKDITVLDLDASEKLLEITEDEKSE